MFELNDTIWAHCPYLAGKLENVHLNILYIPVYSYVSFGQSEVNVRASVSGPSHLEIVDHFPNGVSTTSKTLWKMFQLHW